MERKSILATCSLNQWALDFEKNLANILKSIEIARDKGAKYRLGPELEISGYGCNDHFLEGDTLLHSFQVLAELLENPTCTDIICDVGMPVTHKNVTYNCRVIFLNKKMLLIRPKSTLADGGNYRESRWFAAWSKPNQIEEFFLPRIIQKITGQKTVPIGDAIIAAPDACVGIAFYEEMLDSSNRLVEMSLDGVEIFNSAGACHHLLRKSHVRVDLINASMMKVGGVCMFSNFIGCDGERVYYDGCSLASCNGDILVQGSQFTLREVEVLIAVVDLEDVNAYRSSLKSRRNMVSSHEPLPRIHVDFQLTNHDPFLDTSTVIRWNYYSPGKEISLGPACWLWDYLRRSKSNGFFLPLSGGIDSSSVACIVHSMCRLVVEAVDTGNGQVLSDVRRIVSDDSYTPIEPKELCSRVFTTCYLESSNNSRETKTRAQLLSREVGSHHLNVNIDSVVDAILFVFTSLFKLVPKHKIYGGTARENETLQNIQARVRMVLAYLFAELSLWVRGQTGSFLVLGSVNVDESLIGFTTKYDCSSADVNPIGSLNKQDIRTFVRYCIEEFDFRSLEAIYSAPPTAELDPLVGGKTVYADEDEIGMTYEELAIYGRLRNEKRCGPYGMFTRLLRLWKGKHMPVEVADKVKTFFTYYSTHRHKVAVLTPSYHAEVYNDDDGRFDHRQILYNILWPWQFRFIDKQVQQLNVPADVSEID